MKHMKTTGAPTAPPPSVVLQPIPGTGDRWQIAPFGAMKVPGVVFASESLLPQVMEEEALGQVVNVAALPGIVEASYAMPDVHWGYGFPIGGVAATDVGRGGVVSPGGVGFDISCGVRLLVSPLSADELAPELEDVMDALDVAIPRGLGRGGVWPLEDDRHLDVVLREGARAALAAGIGTEQDLSRCEDGGCLRGSDPSQVSERAHAWV